MGVPSNGWFIVENPIKWMIWEYPYFRKPPNMKENSVSTTIFVCSKALVILPGQGTTQCHLPGQDSSLVVRFHQTWRGELPEVYGCFMDDSWRTVGCKSASKLPFPSVWCPVISHRHCSLERLSMVSVQKF